MALECSYCGARAEDGAARCPQCLRSTGLIAAPEAPAPKNSRRTISAIGAASVVAIALAAAFFTRKPNREIQETTALEPPPGAPLPPLLEVTPELTTLVQTARAAGDPLSRARALIDALAQLRGNAPLAEHAQQLSAPRSNAAILAALRSHERTSSLELARLVTAVLRSLGTEARIALRTNSVRSGTPADPTGYLGKFVIVVANHAADPSENLVSSLNDAAPRYLEGTALEGATLAHSALFQSHRGAHPLALALADAAVRRWNDGAIPLVVRAYIARAAGAPGATGLAAQDLASAIAMQDDSAVHAARARTAVAALDMRTAATEAQTALRRAPRWGEAALLSALTNAATPDGGDRCTPLAQNPEPWTDDALVLCRALAGAGPHIAANAVTPEVRNAAERLSRETSDPARLALASVWLGSSLLATRVASAQRDEWNAWRRLLPSIETPDAGTP